MLEFSVVVMILAGTALVVGRLRSAGTEEFDVHQDDVDLPCPWCRGPTREDDSACPTCDHPFGVADS